ncbi:hypothetical protein HB923_003547 [Salmonella enterica]|nr:hypothetical protein [Salmonella enterica]
MHGLAVIEFERFIPAGAGNTLTSPPKASALSVYPRWRGEHAVSPVDEVWLFRFIPAGAGNTAVSTE